MGHVWVTYYMGYSRIIQVTHVLYRLLTYYMCKAHIMRCSLTTNKAKDPLFVSLIPQSPVGSHIQLMYMNQL
jgi:hypothetical protein